MSPVNVAALNVPLPTVATTVRVSVPVPVTLIRLPTGVLMAFSPTETGDSSPVSVTVGSVNRPV